MRSWISPGLSVSLWISGASFVTGFTLAIKHIKDKKEQKRRALLSGIIVEEDILGNDGADKLANDGALMHTSNAYMAKRAQHRKDLTTVVQKMQAEIWNAYISNADPDTAAADEEAKVALEGAFKDVQDVGERRRGQE